MIVKIIQIIAEYNGFLFQINWRPVCWGYFLQFIFGLLILRWDWGSDKFSKLSHYIVVFLDYTYEGTIFVYGFLADPPNICGMSAVFAFSVLINLLFLFFSIFIVNFI